MRFGVLGPLQVVDADGVSRVVAAPKQRVVLAALLLGGGSMVSAASLAEALWDESPPPNAGAALRNYVMRLRRALGPAGARIVGQPPGWAVELQGSEEFDVAEAGSLWRAARAAGEAGEWPRMSSLLSRAVGLWRGEPLFDVPSPVLVRREADRLAELRLRLTEARVDADLHLGRHDDLVPELRRLAAEHPLREHLRAQLMLACYRSGQQAAALEAYRDARATLAEELGVEPGHELRDLHQKVLAADPGLAAPALAVVTAGQRRSDQPQGSGPEAVAPRQLPAAVRKFTGRGAELTRLTELAGQARADGGRAVVVISGMAGVGKTALAVHWAHQSADLFPDGQLHVNLDGFTPSGEPTDPAGVIRGFLEALGVPAKQVPASAQAQTGLYRSLLASRHMIIVLDNARDAAQVRPLLPGAPECLVLVTSRDQLTGLAATDDAHILRLDVLSDPEAHQMLETRLGADRTAAQQDAVTEIASLCGHLPLALAITAARAAARPSHPLAVLAAELRDTGSRLDALDDTDAASSIRAVFSWSYSQLSPSSARAFRLLGLHPGPDISVPAIASLTGLPADETRSILGELTRAHLLAEPQPGRYAFHDLLRAYAAEQARAHETPDDRHSAMLRMLDHYLASGGTATAIIAGTLKLPVDAVPLARGVRPEDHLTRSAADDWLTAEHAVLLRLIDLAAREGFDVHAWQLPRAVGRFFDWRALFEDWDHTHQIAAEATARLGDTRAQAITFMNWSGADFYRGLLIPAEQHMRAAADLFSQVGDRLGQAMALANLTLLAYQAGRYGQAAEWAQQSYRLSAEAGDYDVQVATLAKIGLCHAHADQRRAAAAVLIRAQQMLSRVSNNTNQAETAHTLGEAHYLLSDYRQAVFNFRTAADLHGEVGDHANQATTLSDLADACHADGRHEEAIQACEQALTILTELHHPDEPEARAKLEKLKAEAETMADTA